MYTIPNQEKVVLTESRDVQHVGKAPVADVHLQEVFVSTLFNDLFHGFGHFSCKRISGCDQTDENPVLTPSRGATE